VVHRWQHVCLLHPDALEAAVTDPAGLLGTLIERWRKQAMDSREESGRIRRTIKEATGAEERCLVRAEVWDKVADELEVAKWKLEDAAALPPSPPQAKRQCAKCGSFEFEENGHESNGPAGWVGDGSFLCAKCGAPAPPQAQEPRKCTCWLETTSTFGSSEARMKCAVHGDNIAASPPAPAQEPRQAFEQWLRDNHPDLSLARADTDQPHDYVNAFTESMWGGWKGATFRSLFGMNGIGTQEFSS